MVHPVIIQVMDDHFTKPSLTGGKTISHVSFPGFKMSCQLQSFCWMFHSRIVRGVTIQSFDFNLLFVSLNLVWLCKYLFLARSSRYILPASIRLYVYAVICIYRYIFTTQCYTCMILYVSLIGISTSPEKHLDIEDVSSIPPP